MCLGGGSDSTSTSSGHASAEVSFNPIITIGGNAGDPTGPDTGSTFAAKLLATPPVKVALPDTPKKEETDSTTKLLTFVAVALMARKVLRG